MHSAENAPCLWYGETGIRVINDQHYMSGVRPDIVVHSGVFHADDIVSAALLVLYKYKELDYRPIFILRTCNRAILEDCASNPDIIILDIGEGQFDHHNSRSPISDKATNPAGEYLPGVPHCSATLLVQADMGIFPATLTGSYEFQKELAAIACSDNGKDRPKEYALSSFDWIHHMNPAWDSIFSFDPCFLQALSRAMEMIKELEECGRSELAGTKVVSKALKKAKSIDAAVVELPSGGIATWQQVLAAPSSKVNFVIWPAEDEKSYILRCVPTEPGSNTVRVPLPEEWRGLSDKALAKVSGIRGAVFCHADGFIGGFKTKKACHLAARKALENMKSGYRAQL